MTEKVLVCDVENSDTLEEYFSVTGYKLTDSYWEIKCLLRRIRLKG